jgi:hypothetical protein
MYVIKGWLQICDPPALASYMLKLQAFDTMPHCQKLSYRFQWWEWYFRLKQIQAVSLHLLDCISLANEVTRKHTLVGSWLSVSRVRYILQGDPRILTGSFIGTAEWGIHVGVYTREMQEETRESYGAGVCSESEHFSAWKYCQLFFQ